MKIIITAPLFPPEITIGSIYIKKLAQTLKEVDFKIQVLTYSIFPEKINGVKITKVNKQLPLPIRLIVFTFKLWKLARKNDVIFSQNGASVEFPIFLMSKLIKKPYIIYISDKKAFNYTKDKILLNYIQRKTFKKAFQIIKDIPDPKPEVTPFDNKIKDKINLYKNSWEKHIKYIKKILKNA